MSPLITKEQIDEMAAILREGISRTMDGLRRSGFTSSEWTQPARRQN
ncbi:hypothetical protein [Mesorhizobium sp. WSM2239]|jgi:CRP-like cAMP-binding protein|uniref:Uncharacterized protein n=2 Tax=unclassified Mesorhizobium TaxID=325217 RepID=A0AAU8DBU8_9HYPH